MQQLSRCPGLIKQTVRSARIVEWEPRANLKFASVGLRAVSILVSLLRFPCKCLEEANEQGWEEY